MAGEAPPLNTDYVCRTVAADPVSYGMQTVLLERADGISGWVTLAGPDVHNLFTPGKVYRIGVQPRDAG